MPGSFLKKSDKIENFFDTQPHSFKITPYKTCLYILLAELEKKQSTESSALANDRRSYYSFCLWSLIGQTNLSLPALKCYIYKFMNDEPGDLFNSFVSALSNYSHKEILPDSENLMFSQKSYPNFIKPLSLIGFFIRNYEIEFLLMDTKHRFEFMRKWSEYLKKPINNDEIPSLSQQWTIKIEETLKLVESEEDKLLPKKSVNEEMDH